PAPWWGAALLKVMTLRPWGATAWSMYYKSLYPTAPPDDLDEYRRKLRDNLNEPGRTEALRALIAASKSSCEARIAEVKAPALIVMGTADPDFPDPSAEANLVASRLHGRLVMIDGAGHYPHAEMPGEVAPAVVRFLGGLNGGATGSQKLG